MKVALLMDSVSRNAGGLYDAVRRLGQSLQMLGEEVRVFGVEDERTSADLAGWTPAPVDVVPPRGPRRFGYSSKLSRVLAAFDPDIVMPQGLWTYTSVVSLNHARFTKRPYVIHPHGMLDPWAVRHSRWKKDIAALLFERRHLEGAACLRSLSHDETRSIRALGLRNPIAMIPNGVDLPPEAAEGQWSEAGRRRFEIDDQRTLLFLGRIHPKKGLSELVEGWRISQARHNGWVLEIAGWDSGGHEARLRDRIARWGLECSVKCVGSLFGECKESALRRASAFILPSISEGLPMAVLEAWSYAKPVLITRQCNLPEGFAADAAIQIESNSESIAGALDHLIRMSDDEIAEMGRRGRRLVEQAFAWPKVAAQMMAVHKWIFGTGEKPECLVA